MWRCLIGLEGFKKKLGVEVYELGMRRLLVLLGDDRQMEYLR